MPFASVPLHHIRRIVQSAIQEDIPAQDVTSMIIIPENAIAQAKICSQEPMRVAGIQVAKNVFQEIDSRITFTSQIKDGQHVKADQVLISLEGPAHSLLMAERTALNFLQHLSGIATQTARFCEAIRGYPARILDTRKTIPGLRVLQKWAVQLGGGFNHRFSLSDGILIKDNHLAILKANNISLADTCRMAKLHGRHGQGVCVEVEKLKDIRKALEGRADIILLDNMPASKIKKAVDIIQGRALVEVSGGITLANVREMAAAGADYISIGLLTHSVPAANIHMEFGKTRFRKPPPGRIRGAG